MSAPPAVDPIDLSTLAFWSTPMEQRAASFAELRAHRPISWHEPAQGVLMPDPEDPGFWAVVRHEDIGHVSRNPALFCSGQGVQFQDAPAEILEASQSFLAMDAPRHTTLRRLVAAAFTPRRVRRISDQIATRARRVVDDLVDHGDGDFVDLVARRLPMETIYDLMGLPEADQDRVALAADVMVSANDPQVRAEQGIEDPLQVIAQALMTVTGPGLELAEARRADPRDDLMTALVQAEVDGERLTDAEIGAFFVLLSVAGNDTTRNSIAHGMRALTRFPEQRRVLTDDVPGRMPAAVEEIVRWATPVMTFRRTAVSDTELAGQPVAAGDKVVMFYESGNRDEAVFTEPHRFEVTRDPNPHVGFGGGGPHFCLGAVLARTQLSSMFTELLTRLPDLQVGPPDVLVGNFVHGVKAMPCTLRG